MGEAGAPVERVRIGRAPDQTSGITGHEERRNVQKLLNLLRESKNLLDLNRRSEMLPLWNKACRIGQGCARRFGWRPDEIPTMESLKSRIENVETVLHKVTWGDRIRQIRSWRRQKVERAQQGIGDLARHFRSADQAQLTVLKKPNGDITGSVTEMDVLLRESWLPIFVKHAVTAQAVPDTEGVYGEVQSIHYPSRQRYRKHHARKSEVGHRTSGD